MDGIAAGANKTTIDSAMSGSSVNPVQNKVVKQYVDDKVAAAGSNITVDAALSSTSTNPVQNKAVKAAIDGNKTALGDKMDKSGGTFTGNVYGKYFCGTWLQSTEASDLGRTPGQDRSAGRQRLGVLPHARRAVWRSWDCQRNQVLR